ncbi:MAG TPA: trehalose-6-phosphate synthase [Ilumatobacteraceae bacterium]|nr:trehalose-6-phosphate synthase [Ilumatobacteraceae bacterium]
MTELIVAANRLPVEAPARGRGRWTRSPGGLAAALHPTLVKRGGSWIGWSGGRSTVGMPTDLGYALHAVDLDPSTVRSYYDGFANSTLWPLYHDFVRPPVYNREWWHGYVNANRRFSEVIAASAVEGARVWVQDYHLQLVPAMLRRARPDLRIGFYLHIPFPSPDLFMTLPWRTEVLEGVAGADVIGFQTPSDADNFRRCAERVARLTGRNRREVLHAQHVAPFPISVDFDMWDLLARQETVGHRIAELRQQLGNPRSILLGIDRLDYTKGIEHRLTAFRELLASGTLKVPDAVLVQVAVPSRDRSAAYRNERVRIEQLVGAINGEYGQVGSPAVHYIHRSFEPDEVAALYRAADVMLVTPVRDGMNLVAKEFVSSRIQNSGVLLLSEFAGAAHELVDAVQVNPHDIDGLKDAIMQALSMSRSESAARMKRLRAVVAGHTVYDWAEQFIDRLIPEPVL